jgi:pyridoxal phosphate enzyme (YggS family)
MEIAEELLKIKSVLPEDVKLVAITKTQPVEAIARAYHTGHRIFGENKVQELVWKFEKLPKDIEWHMVGHLQTNKVKYIAPFVRLIHGVDSLKLLNVIDKEAEKNGRLISCLLQLRIAKEETKFGLTEQDLEGILTDASWAGLKHIKIEGLMGMATFTDDEEQIRNEFRKLNAIFNKVKQKYFSDKSYFREKSMGMSGDYKIAVEEGSTMVRIGSLIFGERKYT